MSDILRGAAYVFWSLALFELLFAGGGMLLLAVIGLALYNRADLLEAKKNAILGREEV